MCFGVGDRGGVCCGVGDRGGVCCGVVAWTRRAPGRERGCGGVDHSIFQCSFFLGGGRSFYSRGNFSWEGGGTSPVVTHTPILLLYKRVIFLL